MKKNYRNQIKIKVVNKFFITASVTSISLATPIFSWQIPSAQAAPVPAKSADSFVDSIGVNTHLTYGDTPYENFNKIKTALQDAGIRHIRDGGHNEDDYINKLLELAAVGVKSNLIFQATPPAIVLEVLKKAKGAVSAAEGPNESDLEMMSFSYNGEGFPEGTRKYQQVLFDTVKGDGATKHLPVVMTSVGWGENADKLRHIGNYSDFCNMHSYPNSGKKPTYDIDWYFIKHAKNMCGESKPMMVTETGYNNALKDTEDGSGISERASGKYIPRMLFENFNRNIKRTFLYELHDESPEGDRESNWGLIRYNGSPKPAYTAIKNINTLLKDKGDFKPKSLDYTFSKDKDIHSTLLQKSDGTFFLILWQDAESYDVDNNKDVQVADKNATISLASPASVQIYNPLESASPIKSVAATKDLQVQVPDSLIVLKLLPSNGQSQLNSNREKPRSSDSDLEKTPTSSQKPETTNTDTDVNQSQSSSGNPASSNSQSESSDSGKQDPSKPDESDNRQLELNSNREKPGSLDSNLEKTPSSSQKLETTNTDTDVNQSQSSTGDPASSNSQSESSDSGKQDSYSTKERDRSLPSEIEQPSVENEQPQPSQLGQPGVENEQPQSSELGQPGVENEQPQPSQLEQPSVENEQPQSSEVGQPNVENEQPQSSQLEE